MSVIEYSMYATPKGYAIKVCKGNSYSEWYRAGTNDLEFHHEHLMDFRWKPTPDEAQKDLDKLAAKLKLEKRV